MKNISIDYTASLKTDVRGEIIFSKSLNIRDLDQSLWMTTSDVVKDFESDDCSGPDAFYAARDLMTSMSADLYRAVKLLSSQQESYPDTAVGIHLADARLGATPVGQASLLGYRIDPDIIIGVKVDIEPDGIRDLDASPFEVNGV